MTLIEVYRNIEIHKVMKNNREMYKVPGTSSFDLLGARKAIDRIIYSKGFSSCYLTINTRSNHSGYSDKSYSLGEYYDSIKSINMIVKIFSIGFDCNRVQVL